MAANADIENGDVAVTSGLDGLYPEGLAVGRVEVVERAAKDQFARIVLTPTAGVENYTHLLVLLVEAPKRSAPPQPVSNAPAPRRSGSSMSGAMSLQQWVRDTFALRATDPIDVLSRGMSRREYLLRPANPLFIWFSLIVALLLNMMPWGRNPFRT